MVLTHVRSDPGRSGQGRLGRGRKHSPTRVGSVCPSALAIEAIGEAVSPDTRFRRNSAPFAPVFG